MRILVIILALSTWGLLLTQEQSPLDTRFAEEITISTPVDGDIYLVAKKITINAPIRGDLVAAAGTIVINDSIASDVLVAGGDINIKGPVGDDIRVAAGSLLLSGTVGGDVLTGAGEFRLNRNSVIAGNLTISGGVIDILGQVGGNVEAVSDKFELKGIVHGSLDARSKEIEIGGTVNGQSAIAANTINVLPGSSFGKEVRYWNSEGSLVIPGDVNTAKVTYDPSIKVQQERWELLGFTSVLMALWYLGTALVIIWLIEYLFSKTLLNAAGVVLQRTAGSIGYGLVFFIAIPILCVALVLTVIAVPIAVILMIAYVIVIICATGLTAIVISNWINRVYYNSNWKLSHITLVAFGVFIILKLFTLTPVIGPFVMAIMACMAIGAVAITVWNRKALATKAVEKPN